MAEQAQRFHSQMKEFIQSFLHTTDSSLVHQELTKLWPNKNPSLIQQLTQKLDYGKVHLPAISCVKYTARRHGLPKGVVESILTLLEPSQHSNSFLKYQIVQTLKYALEHEESVLDFIQLLNALEHIFKSANPAKDGISSNGGQLGEPNFKVTLSQLVECISIKLSPENCRFDHNAGKKQPDNENWIMSQIRTYFDFIDTRTKTLFLEKMEKLGIHAATAVTQITEQDLDVETNGRTGVKPFQSGTEVLGRCSQSSKKGGQLKADAVKTQQTVTSVYKENVSEKTEIENISLANALNSCRTTGKEKEVGSDVTPALVRNNGASVRSYFRTTAQEIDVLLDIANNPNDSICLDDLEYLKNKLTGWKFAVWDSSPKMNTNIVTIFSIVSQRQEICPDIQNALVEYAFESTSLMFQLENKQLKVLKTIQTCAERNDGRIPQKAEQILLNYRKSKECTDDVKKALWKIFKKNDNNLYATFEIALEDLKRSQKRDKPAVIETLDYIREQICDEERAANLEAKFSYLKDLLWIISYKPVIKAEEEQAVPEGYSIIPSSAQILNFFSLGTNSPVVSTVAAVATVATGGAFLPVAAVTSIVASYISGPEEETAEQEEYPPFVKAKVAQIIHDFMAHPNTPKLDGIQLQIFVKLYNNDSLDQSEEDGNLFKSSLIYCILETMNNPDFDSKLLTNELLDLLVTVTLDDSDGKLGTIVLMALGNLVIKNPRVRIPKPFRLAPKLIQKDGIDEEGLVYSGEDKEEVHGLRYSSAMAAHIILQALKQKDFGLAKIHSSLFDLLAQAMTEGKDKNTRILCSESLFFISQETAVNFSTEIIWALQSKTLDEVADIRIHCTAAYCTSVARILRNSEFTNFRLSSNDLDEVTHLFAIDKLVLGTKDFTKIVNDAILDIIHISAGNLTFSDQVFQLLATLLGFIQNSDLDRCELILQIILSQMETNTTGLPDYLMDALESLFVRESKMFQTCVDIFVTASEKYGQEISRVVLDVLYKNLETAEAPAVILRALLVALSVQDLPYHIFRRFDLEFACKRLLCNLYDSTSSDSTTEEFDIEKHFSPKKKTDNFRTNLLKTVKQYFETGMRATNINFELFKACIKYRLNMEMTLQCIAKSAENGQILPKDIIELVLDPKLSAEISSGVQLRLALALVQNNQTLPAEFQNTVILPRFLKQAFNKIFESEGEDARIFSIVNKSLQTTQKLSNLSAVVDKLCAGWKKEAGGNHRQRLEILTSLSSLVNCGEELGELDGTELKSVFLEALTNKNSQFLETGLHGFIALNTRIHLSSKTDKGFFEPADIQLLVRIQRNAASSASVKNLITEFLNSKKKDLNSNLRACINLSNLANRTNSDFILDLPQLLKLGDNEFFDTEACQNRFKEILETESNPEILISTIQIILSSASKNLSSGTLEAISLALVNHAEMPDFQIAGQKILNDSIELGLSFTPKVIQYLEMDSQLNSKLLLKLMSKASTQASLSKELQATFKIQQLIESKKLKESALDKIVTDLGYPVLEPTLFEQLLSTECIKPGISLKIVHLIAMNLQASGPPSVQPLQIKLAKILEQCLIKNEGKVQEKILESFITVISEVRKLEKPKETVNALLNVWNDSKQMSLERQCIILQLFGEIFKNVKFQKPFVKPKVVSLLIELIRNPVPALRKLSIRALRFLQPGSLKSEKGSLDIASIQTQVDEIFKIITKHAFNEIFKGESTERIENERNCDPEFTHELTELLISLTTLDFERLREVREDRSKWKRLLILSDFLGNSIQSIDEQLEFFTFSIQLYEKAKNDSEAQDLFAWLSVRLQDLQRTSIGSLFQSLLRLDAETILQALKKPSKTICKEVAELVVAESIQNKLQFQLNPKLTATLAYRLVLILGPELAQDIFETLVSIESIDAIDSFLNVFTVIDNLNLVKLRSQLKPYLKDIETVQELRIIVECQILLAYIPTNTTRRPRIQRMITALLRNGILVKDIFQLMEITVIKTKEKSKVKSDEALKAFDHALSQSCQYRVNAFFFSQLVSGLIQSGKSKDYILITNTLFREGVFDGNSGVKDIHQVLHEFRIQNSRVFLDVNKWTCLRKRFVKAGYQWYLLKIKLLQIVNGDGRSKILALNAPICDWTKDQIWSWAVEAKSAKERLDPHEFYTEALAVCSVAIKRHRNFNLTKVQVLSCYIALHKLDKDKLKGQLQQVATGSGKSAIIAILAVVRALEGNNVDIYTSSPVLAERDSKEWEPFYQMFGLHASHNGDIGSCYISGMKTCYTRKIVYGDCSQFQFDYLRDKYSALGTLAGRTLDFAIVDEVDSMMLDDSSKLARLSTTLPGMDLLEVMYHFLWERLAYLQSHLYSIKDNYFYLEGQVSRSDTGMVLYKVASETNELMVIKDLTTYIYTRSDQELTQARIFPVDNIEDFVKEQLSNYIESLIKDESVKVKIPKHLQAFVRAQTPLWVESALTAMSFQENVHYIVSEDMIKPVDYRTTGIVQSSTNWNNGLHQFLGLKHSLKINPETVTTNFLSNLSMLSKYGTNLIGFTGTLGSQAGRELLYKVYNVKLLTLPETNFKRYIQFPDILVPNEEQWYKEIVISCMAERSKGRGVLIICETIQAATAISFVLSGLKVKVKLYTKNEEDQEKHIEQIHPGDIIVATNLAGRGTDINTNEIEDNGGLHVCLTFLPHSSRIEEQAFGRTSRQGRKGTGQLIIIEEPDVSDFKGDRDSKESATLQNFQDHHLDPLRTKGKVFEKFCSYFGEVRAQIRQEVTSQKGYFQRVVDGVSEAVTYWTPPSLYETLVLQSIEERWAMFLRRVEDEDLSEETTLKQYQLLEEEIESQLKVNSLEVLKKGQNAFYFIQLGNDEYRKENLVKAEDYYDMALRIDPDFGVGAQIGLGAVLLKNGTSTNYKESALERFGKAQLLLNTEMAWITVMQTLTQKKLPADDNSDSPLLEQLMEKSSLLGQLINAVEGNVSAVEKSLRRVHYTGHKNQRLELFTIPNDITQASSNQRDLGPAYKKFDLYSMSFHDLTFRNDAGVRDQAVESLPSDSRISKSKFKVGLRCKATDLKRLLEHQKVNFLKEVPDLSIELLGIQVDTARGQLLFNFEALKVTPKSYNLEFTGATTSIQSIALALFKAGNLKDFEFKSVTESKDFPTPITVSESISTEKMAESLEDKITKSSGITSIKLLQVSETEIPGIIQSLPQSNNPPSVNLTLNSIESGKKEMLIETWDKLLSRYKNTLHLRQMSSNNAKNVIPLLRELNSEFILDIYELDLKSVMEVLKNAVIVQENMEQTKLQDLAELFMSGRLPYQEIRELSARGLSILILFNEKRFIPWISICTVCALATVQVVAGGFLISTGFGASLGMSLVTEGMSDFTTAYRAYSSRQFNWADFATQKAVSLIISASTMGLNNMKNGAKGIKILTGGSQLTSQASASALTATGMNLGTLSVQHIAVRGMETAGRIAIKGALDKLTGFCFDQLRESITAEVSSRIATEFAKTDLNRELSRKWAIQKFLEINAKSAAAESRVQKTVEGAAKATMNPKASGFSSFWDSVGGPLANNFLSDPNLVGSSWNNILLTIGAIGGIAEISSACSRVCTSIEEKLREEPDRISEILSKSKISPATINKLVKELKFNSEGDNGFVPKLMPDESLFENKEFKYFTELLTNLHNSQKKFDKNNSERSRIEKSVVDLVTSHIIKVANSHLVSPVMSKVAGSMVKSISEDLQGRFLVDSEMGESKTITGLINENAKEHMKIYQQMERVEVLERMKTNLTSGGQSVTPPSKEVSKMFDDVAGNAPLGADMISAMAKKNNLNIKTVTDPNYKPTKEEIASGVRIVLYEPPPAGSPKGTPGHFQLKTESGDGFVSIPADETDKNNCGVNIVSHLLAEQDRPKSADDLRLELANQIVNSPQDAEILVENNEWFQQNRGEETTNILQIGGARKASEDKKNVKRRKSTGDGDDKDKNESGCERGKVKHTTVYRKEEVDENGVKKVEEKSKHEIPLNVGEGEPTKTTGANKKLAQDLSREPSKNIYPTPPSPGENNNENNLDATTQNETNGSRSRSQSRPLSRSGSRPQSRTRSASRTRSGSRPQSRTRSASRTRSESRPRSGSRSRGTIQHDQLHTINKEAGGTGEPENITVQTHQANMQQKTIDQPVLDVLDKHRGEPGQINVDHKVISREVNGLPVVEDSRFTFSAEGNPELEKDLDEALKDNPKFTKSDRGYTARLVNAKDAYVVEDPNEPSSETNNDFDNLDDIEAHLSQLTTSDSEYRDDQSSDTLKNTETNKRN